MKVGVRKPNIKKSIKARTTGKVKRSVKKAVNPLYGKKGMGVINNPKKAVYNKVYNKTTISVTDIVKDSAKGSSTSSPKVSATYEPAESVSTKTQNQPKNKDVLPICVSIIGTLCCVGGNIVFGIILIIAAIVLFYINEKNKGSR